MSYLAKVGSFNINPALTATQTQAITGVGFQPKIVLFWWSGSTGTGDGVAGGNISPGMGAAISSSSRACFSSFSLDAGASSDTASVQSNSSVIRIFSDAAIIDGIMDFSSMDAGGFTLVVDDQFTIAARISYLALGGTDLTNVYIGSASTATSAGNYNVTGVGFQPDAVLTLFGNSANDTINPRLKTNFGMATGASNQGVVFAYSVDAATTSNTAGAGASTEVLVFGDEYADFRETFVEFIADGFTLNHLEGSVAYTYQYVCLKGGQYKVHSLTTRTDGNDIVESDVGFQPVALLLASANRALSNQNSTSANARLSIGAATSATERAAQAISDEDNLADTETAFANYDTAVYAQVVDDATVGLMDIKSIDAGGFTAVMDDTDPSACWVSYLAIGAASSLVPAEGAQTQTGDAATLITIDLIAPAEGAQTQTGDAAAAIPIAVIAPAEGAQAQAGDAPTLTTIEVIAPAESTQSQSGDAATLIPIAVIAPAEGSQTQTMDEAVATEATTTPTVQPAESTQSQTGDSPTVITIVVIQPGEGAQAQVMDTPTATWSGPGSVTITPAEGFQTQVMDVASPIGVYAIAPDQGSQTQTGDEATISAEAPSYVIAPIEGSQTQTGDAAGITGIWVVVPGKGFQYQTGDEAGLTLGLGVVPVTVPARDIALTVQEQAGWTLTQPARSILLEVDR